MSAGPQCVQILPSVVLTRATAEILTARYDRRTIPLCSSDAERGTIVVGTESRCRPLFAQRLTFCEIRLRRIEWERTWRPPA